MCLCPVRRPQIISQCPVFESMCAEARAVDHGEEVTLPIGVFFSLSLRLVPDLLFRTLDAICMQRTCMLELLVVEERSLAWLMSPRACCTVSHTQLTDTLPEA